MITSELSTCMHTHAQNMPVYLVIYHYRTVFFMLLTLGRNRDMISHSNKKSHFTRRSACQGPFWFCAIKIPHLIICPELNLLRDVKNNRKGF